MQATAEPLNRRLVRASQAAAVKGRNQVWSLWDMRVCQGAPQQDEGVGGAGRWFGQATGHGWPRLFLQA